VSAWYKRLLTLLFVSHAPGSFFAIFAFLVAALTQEYYHDAETAELWWFITAVGMIGVLNKEKLHHRVP